MGGSMKRVLVAMAAALALATCGGPVQKSNDTVFVSNETSNVVTLVDGATGSIEGQLATGPRPRGMAFSPDRRDLLRRGQQFQPDRGVGRRTP